MAAPDLVRKVAALEIELQELRARQSVAAPLLAEQAAAVAVLLLQAGLKHTAGDPIDVHELRARSLLNTYEHTLARVTAALAAQAPMTRERRLEALNVEIQRAHSRGDQIRAGELEMERHSLQSIPEVSRHG